MKTKVTSNGYCRYCGKELTPSNKSGHFKWYCSKSCQYKQRKVMAEKTPVLICMKCGCEFSAVQKKRVSQKYCSRECYLNRNFFTLADGQQAKRCTKCKTIKPLNSTNFHTSSRNSDGYASWCKACNKKDHAVWAKTARAKKLTHESNDRNVATIKAYHKRMLPKRREVEAVRRRTDQNFALKNRMRCLMYSTIRRGKDGRRWQDLTGYSVEELKSHLEKKFTGGMSWERFLAGEIHIDHIIPISVFNFTSTNDIDFKKCWAISNLQPLWAFDNLSKSNRLKKSFQPSLGISI